jgi:hypothetical protein
LRLSADFDKMIRANKRRTAKLKKQHGLRPGASWRVQDCGTYNHKVQAKKAAERFDEIAVDFWLHIERCDNRNFYGSIGGLTLWWTVKRNGDCVITHAELRDDVKIGEGALAHVLPELAKIAQTGGNEQKRRGRMGKRG